MKPCEHCGVEHRPATDKQARFVELYLVDLNAAKAAREAGYADSVARTACRELLSKPQIQCVLQKQAAARSKRTQIDADTVLQALVRMATHDLTEILDEDGQLKPVREWPPEFGRVIAGLETVEIKSNGEVEGQVRKVRIPDRVRALELLGKHLRLFADVVQHEGTVNLRHRIAEGRRRAGLLPAAESSEE